MNGCRSGILLALGLMLLKYVVFVAVIAPSKWILLVYHFLLFLMLINYYLAIFTSPGYSMEINDEEKNEEENANPVRWCEKCDLAKGIDVHHCSTCGKCILKMDHHCPWTNNCVGLYNKKFFFLFLLYTSTTCLFMGITSSERVIQGNFNNFYVNLVTTITWILAIGIGLILGVFFIFHFILIVYGITTLDFFAGRRPSSSLSILQRMENDLGRNRWAWLLPISPMIETNHITFISNEEPTSNLLTSLEKP